jgi:pimeloyl-ACP methyl ester carboxylesterase
MTFAQLHYYKPLAMTSKRLIKITFPFILLIGFYFMGPAPDAPVYDSTFPTVPQSPDQLEDAVAQHERQHKLKPNNEARIVWADSSKQKTKYAVVYLHGFSASQKEGDPTHLRFAKQFGCNMYLSRLSDHGVDTVESLLYFTADRAWESAKEALAIGNAIGEKVIIMSTSTGSSLAFMLAAEYPERVHALINMSPNIEINNPAAFLLNNPWGLYIARIVMSGKYRVTGADDESAKYWNRQYRLEATVQLQELLETKMNEETFKRITHPSLTLYYYRNELEQDPEVKVSAMLEMHEAIATPDSLKVAVAIPNAGAHVIGGALASKDVESVYKEIEKFAIDKLRLETRPLATLE